MKYAVIIAPEAQANIGEAHAYIAAHSPMNAAKWLHGIYQRVNSLESFPRRYGKAREQDYFLEEIRQLVYKSYRIIFTVDDKMKTVHVLHVRHVRRRAIGEPHGEHDE